jgi:hypothetical protein
LGRGSSSRVLAASLASVGLPTNQINGHSAKLGACPAGHARDSGEETAPCMPEACPKAAKVAARLGITCGVATVGVMVRLATQPTVG